MSKRKQPRDLYGLEAALIELAHDDPFLQPHRGSDKRYPAGIARTDLLRDHGLLLAALSQAEL